MSTWFPELLKKAFLERLPEMEHLCGGDGGLRTPKGHDDKRQADEMFREDIKRIQKDLHSSGRRTSTEQNQLAFVCRVRLQYSYSNSADTNTHTQQSPKSWIFPVFTQGRAPLNLKKPLNLIPFSVHRCLRPSLFFDGAVFVRVCLCSLHLSIHFLYPLMLLRVTGSWIQSQHAMGQREIYSLGGSPVYNRGLFISLCLCVVIAQCRVVIHDSFCIINATSLQ